jgi:cytidyltransferase-like protein
MFGKVALGGTFDRLHEGHKKLLEKAVEICSCELIVGITTPILLNNKKYAELIEPYEIREGNVLKYLMQLHPKCKLRLVPLVDSAGPTSTEADIEAIVVSEETKDSASQINQVRKEKGYSTLTIIAISCINNQPGLNPLDPKLSSSSLREQEWKQKNKL